MIGTLWVKCNHLTVEEQQVLQRGQRYILRSEYDWCPLCHVDMKEKANKVQGTFDDVFGKPEDEG